VSRLQEKETKKIARTVFAMPRPCMEMSGPFGPAGDLKVWEQPLPQDLAAGWADLGELDYSGFFDGMEQCDWYGISNGVSDGMLNGIPNGS
jgi:hypothetical protein